MSPLQGHHPLVASASILSFCAIEASGNMCCASFPHLLPRLPLFGQAENSFEHCDLAAKKIRQLDSFCFVHDVIHQRFPEVLQIRQR